MIYSHDRAVALARDAIAHVGVTATVTVQERDRVGTLMFTGLAEVDGPGRQKGAVRYTLPVEPTDLWRRVVITLAPSAARYL